MKNKNWLFCAAFAVIPLMILALMLSAVIDSSLESMRKIENYTLADSAKNFSMYTCYILLGITSAFGFFNKTKKIAAVLRYIVGITALACVYYFAIDFIDFLKHVDDPHLIIKQLLNTIAFALILVCCCLPVKLIKPKKILAIAAAAVALAQCFSVWSSAANVILFLLIASYSYVSVIIFGLYPFNLK